MIATLEINCLIRGNGVEPGTHPPTPFKCATLEMHLKERLLENIFRCLGTPKVATEVGKELPLITPDKFFECGTISL
jgi:hypothetical protein